MSGTVEAATGQKTIGDLLRQWRERRRLSQLTLALEAEISSRHLSFLETGRSRPSQEMVLRLAEQLEVPLRERNALLLAAGYAPVYRESSLDSPEMAAVRAAMRQLIGGHEPYPAIVIDRSWNLLDMNESAVILTEGASPELLKPPVNILKLAMHPSGIAPRILNLGELRGLWLGRLQRLVTLYGRAELAQLYDEVRAYPFEGPERAIEPPEREQVVQTVHLQWGDEALKLFTIRESLLDPFDVTIDELAIESFYPADAATAETLQRRRASRESDSTI